jgi:7-cyano-7-deazaguanine reductase
MTNKLVLGKHVAYSFTYSPQLLCPIPRRLGQDAAEIATYARSWQGEDIWNIYELSWLNPTGKPQVAMAEVRVPASSPHLIESKSLKLYCNSFNMSRFENCEEVQAAMRRDLSEAAGAEVGVVVIQPKDFGHVLITEPEGICLDDLIIEEIAFQLEPSLLVTETDTVEQTLFSRLFRSCCPVTGQPDWATVTVSYVGKRIVPESVLRYVVSYREHTGFHEACVESIFSDIMTRCRPEELTVSARFTRRGGIDINPVRSTRRGPWPNLRDPRQ